MKTTIHLIGIAIFLMSCGNSQKPTSESPVEIPEEPAFTIEDPFAETNLVDNIRLVDLENNRGGPEIFCREKNILEFLGYLVQTMYSGNAQY